MVAVTKWSWTRCYTGPPAIEAALVLMGAYTAADGNARHSRPRNGGRTAIADPDMITKLTAITWDEMFLVWGKAEIPTRYPHTTRPELVAKIENDQVLDAADRIEVVEVMRRERGQISVRKIAMPMPTGKAMSMAKADVITVP